MLSGSKILQETFGSSTIKYYYGHGDIVGFNYNGTDYYYRKNLQGDIIEIYTASGTKIAEYEYDAWGNHKIYDANGNEVTSETHIGYINPIRYRGYYYDVETGLYYVYSRYYDAEVGRWINADDIDYLGAEDNLLSYNLFSYCVNNPVNRFDVNGNWSMPGWAKKVVAAVAVVAVVAAVAAVTVATAGAGTAAAVIAVGAAKGAAIGMASGAAIGAATGAVSHRVSTGSWSGACTAALNGMGDGALSGAVTGAISGGASAALRYGTFSSKSSLTGHFAKHGDEFGDMYTNAKEYAQGAKYVIKNGTYVPEANAYIRFLGTQGKANYAFVGMKAGGRVSTYHVESVSKMIKKGISMFN